METIRISIKTRTITTHTRTKVTAGEIRTRTTGAIKVNNKTGETISNNKVGGPTKTKVGEVIKTKAGELIRTRDGETRTKIKEVGVAPKLRPIIGEALQTKADPGAVRTNTTIRIKAGGIQAATKLAGPRNGDGT